LRASFLGRIELDQPARARQGVTLAACGKSADPAAVTCPAAHFRLNAPVPVTTAPWSRHMYPDVVITRFRSC
jgi:hypothetical protein